MRMKVFALASITALFAASGAHATQIYITNVGVQSSDTTTLTGTINSSPFSESPITTLIELTTTTGSILPVFCVDLFHDIGIGARAHHCRISPARSRPIRLALNQGRATRCRTLPCPGKSRPWPTSAPLTSITA